MSPAATERAFCHLHAHSTYTLLTGAAPPERIAEKAARLGLSRAALTDTNALYAAVPFSRACRAAGVVPITGAHLQSGRHHAVLLARDGEGYANLCRLVTGRRLEERFSLCDRLPDLSGGLAVLVHDPRLLAKLARRLDRNRLFAEVVPHGRAAAAGTGDLGEAEACCAAVEDADRRAIDVFDRKAIDPPPLFRPADVLAAAESLGLRSVVTAAAYMCAPAERSVHRLLVAIKKAALITELPEGSLAPPGSFLKPPLELAAGLPDTRRAREALTNAGRIAAECGFDFAPSPPRFPVFRLDPGETPYSRLCKLAFGRAADVYRPLRQDVIQRLARELQTIDSHGFSDYFIIVHDIVSFARSQGIPAVGRGSAAGSLVAYLLGITNADPLAYDLYFERFLNPERTGCPDIDVDLCWKKRDDVIDYVYGKYGAEHVAMIATFNTFRFRAAFRDIALACGAPPSRVNTLSRLLPRHAEGSPEQMIAEYPEMRRFPLRTEPYGEALRGAAAVSGFPRHLSIHCGGLVIGHEPLSGLVPLERAAKGIVITQYDMDPVEELGLVKIDLLGQRGLTAVTEAKSEVFDSGEGGNGPDAVPEKDAATTELLRSGRTIGCFQIESPAMRGLLAQMRACRREDVIAAVALIRPGPSSSGMKDAFIRRHLGEEAARFAHPSLEEVLKETHGVMLYQEDVLRVARAAAGFTLTEADTLRKAMTKKRTQGLMRGLRKRFVAGALERGLSGEDAERIFSNMEGFASYSFCKAHAVTYGLIAFEAAYLKAHFPAELLAAVIANGGGFYGSGVYIEEARRLGVRILPPGVNHSGLDCRSEKTGERGAIRPGLGQVAGLSRATIEAILRERAKRPFLSLADFLQRVEPAAGEAEALVLCGAFDFTDLARPELLWRLKTGFNDPGRSRARGVAERQLFGPPPARAGRPLPPIPDYDLSKKLELEYEFLGFTPTCHPMTLFASLAERERALPCARLAGLAGRRVKTAGWAVAARRVRTARGRLMKFLTLEDSSGVVEATLFPEAYRRLGHLTAGGGPYLAEGVMESRQGFPSLSITELRPLGASDDGSTAWEGRAE